MSDRIRVLLVDDEESWLKPMLARLVKRGFEAEGAASGPDALALAQGRDRAFEVAVIDYLMAPPNGIETMLQLREIYPGIEAIILTGWGDITPGLEAMEKGAFRYRTKNMAVDELALDIRTAARFGRQRLHDLAMSSLLRAGQELGSARNEQHLYELLYQEAHKLLPAMDGFSVGLWDAAAGTASFPFCLVNGRKMELGWEPGHRGLTEYAVERGQALWLPDGDQQFRLQHELAPPRVGEYSSSAMVAPMFFETTPIGAISVLTFRPGVHFTRDESEVLQAFANQAPATLVNLRQLQESEELHKAVRALATVRQKEPILHAIVKEAHELLGSELTGLILQDEDGLLYKVRPVIPENGFELFAEPRQEGGVTRWVVTHRQPKVIDDTAAEELVKDEVRDIGVRSMLAMPLVHSDRSMGVLYAHTFKPRHFSSHDVNLWSAFAAQAAAALHAATEEDEILQGYRRLDEAQTFLNQGQGLNDTLARVASAAKSIFQADSCRMIYVDPPTGRILSGMWATDDRPEYRVQAPPQEDGPARDAIRGGQPIYCPQADTPDQPKPVEELVSRGLKSFACLPLMHGERVIGVLQGYYFCRSQTFGNRFRWLFEGFGARAAIALDRAGREETNIAWQELERHMAASADLDEICQLFTDHALSTVGADLAVFYYYDPSSMPGVRWFEGKCFRAGDFRTQWKPPSTGRKGGVHNALEAAADGVLIVNDLTTRDDLHSAFTHREEVKAYVGLRVEAVPTDTGERQLAGALFLSFRQRKDFRAPDLAGLHLAGAHVAAAILWLRLANLRERQQAELNRRTNAILDIFATFREGKPVLGRIAHAIHSMLGVDACTVLEYDAQTHRFSQRGAAGLSQTKHWSPPEYFETRFLDGPEYQVILDVSQDADMRGSSFVQREGIRCAVVHKLWVEKEPLGLLFCSFRQTRQLTTEMLDSIGSFAKVAAAFMYETRQRRKLKEASKRLKRQMFLNWVSMVAASWGHSVITWASAVRNYAAVLSTRLEREGLPFANDAMVREAICGIDAVAAKIADAFPKVPQSWEMHAELVPLAPLLAEVVLREKEQSILQAEPYVPVKLDAAQVAGVQVLGYGQWLIYALGLIMDNARRAIAGGQGAVSIDGRVAGSMALVRVHDTGGGIPPSIKRKLFKDLVLHSTGSQGMGIGHLLAAAIIESHGGSIGVEGTGPTGTTILIQLPVA